MNFGDFTDGGNPNAADYIAGYRTGGGVGSDRRWLRSTFASPPTNDGLALGTTSLGWSDAFFASGAVLKWNNAASLTHSSTALSFADTSISVDVTDAANSVSYPAFAWPLTLSAPTAFYISNNITSASSINTAGLSVQTTASATAPASGAPGAISAGTLLMRSGLDAFGILGYINNDVSLTSPTGTALWGIIRGSLKATGAVDGLRSTSESSYPTSATTTITVTIDSPAVVTWTGHGFSAGQEVAFVSTGSLPTGMVSGFSAFVLAAGLTNDTFRFAYLPGGTAVNTSGTQSGVHSGYIPVHPRNGLWVTNDSGNAYTTGVQVDGALTYGVRVGADNNNTSPTHPFSFFGFTSGASWPLTTELWYVTSSGSMYSASSVTAAGAGSSFAAGGQTGVSAYFGSNLDGQFPTVNSGLAIGTNRSGSATEADFICTNTAATTSFNWYQQTGASAVTLIGSLSTTKLDLPQTTASTTTGTGALVVAGGAGIAGSVNIGGNLFLASTKKIDFNAGDVTVTHSSNTLTFAGASSGYLFDTEINIASNGLLLNGTSSIIYFGGIQTLSRNGGTGEFTIATNASDVTLAPASKIVNISGSGAAINFNTDVSLTQSTDTLTVAGGSIKLAVGSTAFAPLMFQAGTNLSSAADGAMEFDGQALFFSPDASDRRIIPTVAICRLHAGYTLADSTTLQKIFNATTNGTVTLPAGSYVFEAIVAIDAMSATSGNAALSIVGAGGATVSNLLQVVVGIDGAKATAGAASGASWTVTTDVPVANTSVVTAGVSTEMAIMWKGSFETTAGTIIPSVDLITGGVTPVVKLGSYFMCWRMGAATDVTQGNWS